MSILQETINIFKTLSLQEQIDFLRGISQEDCKEILFNLDKKTTTEVFCSLGSADQKQFMQALTHDESKSFIYRMQVRGKTDAFNSLLTDDRKLFLDALQINEREAFITDIRTQAVKNFWTNERELIKQGVGTREWTPEQMEAIFFIGNSKNEGLYAKAPFQLDTDGNLVLKKNGKVAVYYGHHMLSVEEYPAYAGDYRNIQALDTDEHYTGAHNGDTTSPTNWYYDPDAKTKVVLDGATIDFDNNQYPPYVIQTKGFRSDEAMRNTYSDFDKMSDGEKLSLKYIDRVLMDSDSVDDLTKVTDRLSTSKKYDVNRFDNLRFHVDANNKIICDNLTEITGGEYTSSPSNSVFDTTIGEIKNFSEDVDVSSKFGADYDNFSTVEKMQAKQIYYYVCQITNLDGVPINDDVLARYLIASNKTVDKLNDVDKAALAVARKIGDKSEDVTKLLSKVSKYDNVFKVASKVGGVVDAVGTAASIGISIYNAVDAYNKGDKNKAAAIIMASTAELAAGSLGGWAITSAIAPYLMGFGSAVGGPIGAGIGGILAGVLGYGLANVAGSELFDFVMGLFGQSEKVRQPVDPLVLDLAGNGFAPTTVKDGAYFDLDQNGFAEKMGWISGDDAWLAIDKNGDNKINNGNELFGDKSILKTGEFAKNGFEALMEYDTNKDGIISEKDADFDSLLLWKDINGNGISENGELISLRDAGIKSINLGYTSLKEVTGSGTILGNTASFIKTDGSEHQVAEYWVNNETYNTQDLNPVEIPEDVLAFPNVKEIGLVPSLNKAMAADESGRIKKLVTEFMNSSDDTERCSIIEQILLISTGAEKLEANSRGGNFDAQKLRIIESMLGRGFKGTNGINPNAGAAVQLKIVYSDLINTYYCELIAQTTLKPIMPYIRVNETAGEKTVDLFYLRLCLPQLLKNDNLSQLRDLSKYIKYLEKSGMNGFNEFAGYFGSISDEYMKNIVTGAGVAVFGTASNEILASTPEKTYLFGEGGNDTLLGSTSNDVLDGGTGDDYLSGGAGNDTYIFKKGCGQDTIYDYDGTAGNVDTLIMGEGILPGDIVLNRNKKDLELIVSGTSDKVTLKDYFNTGYELRTRIEKIEFADGTVWNDEYICQSGRLNVLGTSDSDSLYGADGYISVLNGYEGNDSLYGGTGNDILDGGTGNDYLSGGTGNDTYIFKKGCGQDTIYDYDGTAGNVDTLIMGEGILPGDIVLNRNKKDLELIVSGTSDKVTLKDYFNTGYELRTRIEKIEFADGTVWNDEYIRQSGRLNVLGTSDSDSLYGADGYINVLNGYEGNDSLNGGTGNDIMYGGSGNDNLYGNAGNDILDGGTGNDYLSGEAGNDTYIFKKGCGQDTIYDYDGTAGNVDTLIIGEGILPGDIVLNRNKKDLELIVSGTSDKVTLKDYFNTGYELRTRIEKIEFADGTVWNDEYICQSGRLNVLGTSDSDSLSGVDGYISVLNGYEGNDSLYGGTGNDILDGGTGNDYLSGGTGNDTYIFKKGCGQDTIYDYDGTAGNVDTLIMGEGILPEDIVLNRNKKDLELIVSGTNDKVTLKDYFNTGYELRTRIEKIEFADGTVWNDEYIRQSGRLNVLGTSDSDSLYGADGYINVFNGYEGNDSLNGGTGNDIMYGGSGNDNLYGNAGNDILDGGTGNDYLSGEAGNDTYIFKKGCGQDTIYDYDGTAGNVDTLIMGEGILPGDIVLNRNKKDLELIVSGTSDKVTLKDYFNTGYELRTRIEKIEFADGTVWNDEYICQSGRLNVLGTSDSDSLSGVDGYISVLNGYEGNDSLYGGTGNDILDGGTGNDYLSGGTGNDTYIFKKGCGQDTIYDYDGTAGNVDTLIMGEGILPGDIVLNRNKKDLELIVSGTSDKVTLKDYFNTGYEARTRIEKIEFADGTVWNDEYIRQSGRLNVLGTSDSDSLYGADGYINVFNGYEGNDSLNGGTGNDIMYGGSGNDNLYGNAENDILDGGTGNDYLSGEAGNDTYIFKKGCGQDTIYDYDGTAGNVDTLIMGEGILPGDIVLNRNKKNLELIVSGTSDKVTLKDYFNTGYELRTRIEKIEFADGTVWNDEYICQSGRLNVLGTSDSDSLSGVDGYISVLNGYEGNDSLYGGTGNDILDGGTGNDYLSGGTGNDTYIFKKGCGQDTIYDYDGTAGNVDTLIMGEGILPGDIVLNRNKKDLELIVSGTSDKVTLKDYFNTGYEARTRIEKIEFADGTVWNDEYIRQSGRLNVLGTSDSDSLYGADGYINVLNGYEGNDSLNGGTGNDILDGGTGNDYLSGGAGNDTYIFGNGYGEDKIFDYDTASVNCDMVKFGEDTLNLIFAREGNNLKISVNNTTDALTVDSWYSGNAYQIEQLEAIDGSILSNTHVEQLIQAMAAFTTQNGMSWNQAITEKPQDVQNILAQFWAHE